jgi:hypothetical protein
MNKIKWLMLLVWALKIEFVSAQDWLPPEHQKMFIANYMSMFTPGNFHLKTDHYRPDGYYKNLGGVCLDLPFLSYLIPQPKTEKGYSDDNPDSQFGDYKQLISDDFVDYEMRAAKLTGIDGFHFWYPTPPQNKRGEMGNERVNYAIEKFFEIAEKENLDFALTLQIGKASPDGKTTEEKVKITADHLQKIWPKIKDSKKWLKTKDGQYVFFTYETSSFVEGDGKNKRDSLRNYKKLIPEEKRALDMLAEALGIKVFYFYLPSSFASFETTFRKDNLSSDELKGKYKDYILTVLENFPGITGWNEIQVGPRKEVWDEVVSLAKSKNKPVVPALYPQKCESRVWFTSEDGKKQKIQNMQGGDGKLSASTGFRHYIPGGLSFNLRQGIESAIQDQASLISVTTWNDFGEGHNIAPSLNNNFGYSLFFDYYKELWRTGAIHPKVDEAVVLFKKYPLDGKVGSIFAEQIHRPDWIIDEDSWNKLREKDKKIEIVTFLTADGELWVNGKDRGQIHEGMSLSYVDQEIGQVLVEIKRDHKTVLKLEPSEWITDSPYRTDPMTFLWSSREDAYFKKLLDHKNVPRLSEYKLDANGMPNWKTLYDLPVK